MAGEILFAGTSEEVVRLRVAVVSARGTCGRRGGEFEPRFAVIAGYKKALPIFAGDLIDEAVGGEGGVNNVAFGCVRRQLRRSERG